MRRKKLKFCIPAALVFLMAAAAVSIHAASVYKLAYVERFETNAVDIHIQEISALKEGENTENLQLADANRDLSYVPRIINGAADCYIRAKVNIEMNGECERPLTLEDIYGLGNEWTVKGEYFYCTEILSAGKYIDLFKGLHVPEDWDYGNVEDFSIEVKAEAVQSANFKPDFSKKLPWGAVEIKEVTAASGNKCVEAVPVSVISDAEYSSGGGFQCNTAELFDEFGSMMPGDRYEKTVRLKNSSENMLQTQLNITAGNSELSEKMNLRILNDGVEIYTGTVAAAGDEKTLNIAEIPGGRTGKITFEVWLPADADNNYAKVQDDIIWELNAEEIADETVQTGDRSSLVPYAVIVLFALLIMACSALQKRKERNETHN